MKREWWIAAIAAGTSAFLFAYIMLAYMPLAKKLNQRRQVLELKEKELTEVQQLIARLGEFQERSARVQIVQQQLEERLPSRTRMPELLKDITRVATECNIKEFQFTPQPQAARKDYIEQPIRITASCSYHALGLFISRLSHLPRLVVARNIKITGRDKTGKTESITAELVLVTYVHKQP